VKELLVDSSILIDFFQGSLDAETKRLLENRNSSFSAISYFEVCKFFYNVGKTAELVFVKQKLDSMHYFHLTGEICFAAAKISHSIGLSMADSIIYTTARLNDCDLVTSDSDLKGKPGVLFVKK